jgi:glycerol-3-phosphate acyltransferase PlsY
MNEAVILAIAYLLGSVPFGYILVRTFRHEDIRASGSGNIGATNVMRSGGKGLAIATLVLDALKGVAAVLVARHFFPGDIRVASLAALVAILGHVFPVWLAFRGGKGVATALGVFLALCWPAALCALGVFIVITVSTRYVSLASVVSAISLPIFFHYFNGERVSLVLACACAAIVVVKHHGNIGRLVAGTENKFGASAKA